MMRSFKSSFSPKLLKEYQKGVLQYIYKDTLCLKSPIDMSIYMRLIWKEKPMTIIEIGSKEGGSALFFSDLLKLYQFESQIISIDIKPPEIAVEKVTFLRGDVRSLNECFENNLLYDLPRPWLVIEDSAHTFQTTLAALNFFAPVLHEDEIIVIEDGILNELGHRQLYKGGPNRAIKKYFDNNPDNFEIAVEYCDMFGYNATYNPNGYLRKISA